jgi:hypothetical protein
MDINTLGKIIAFLCSVPPDSSLRLMLQLALAVSVPEDKREKLLSPLQRDEDWVKLLSQENFLATLINADGDLGEAEKNMLLEAMDRVGLVVPLKTHMTDTLCEALSENLVDELEEIQSSGSVEGRSLVW